MSTNTDTCRCCRLHGIPQTDTLPLPGVRYIDVLRFDVRGISGTIHQGRVLVRGSNICNECSDCMESF